MNTYIITIVKTKTDNPYQVYSDLFDELEKMGYDLIPCEKTTEEEIKNKTIDVDYLEIQIDIEDNEEKELYEFLDTKQAVNYNVN